MKFPKASATQDRAKRKRGLAEKARLFREAVWTRDCGECQACKNWCRWPNSTAAWPRRIGHVHHLRGRNVAPEDRYNPDQAVLLCAVCHRAVHDGKLRLTVK